VAYHTIAKPWPRAKKRAAARVFSVYFAGDPHLVSPPNGAEAPPRHRPRSRIRN
jgi:hypothetical protein